MTLRQSTPRVQFDLLRVVTSVYGLVALLLVGVAAYTLATQTVVGSIVGSVVTLTPTFLAATAMGLLLVATFFAVRRFEPSPGR
jgi:uncharacterized Tic20 family protein